MGNTLVSLGIPDEQAAGPLDARVASPKEKLRRVRYTGSVADRFWPRVQVAEGDTCWLWTGSTNCGYGQLYAGKRNGTKLPPLRAHRVAFELTYGPIPPGMFCLHTCDTPACCNPEHLWLGFSADNSKDMQRKGRAKGRRKHPENWMGSNSWRAVLNEKQVATIKWAAARGAKSAHLARAFGVRPTTIYPIVYGVSWRHVAPSREVEIPDTAWPAPPRLCSIPGCERKHQARDMCRFHWSQWQRTRGPHSPGRNAGEENGQARLVRSDVLEIRERLATDEPVLAIAEFYGVSIGCIYSIRRGHTWSWLPTPPPEAP